MHYALGVVLFSGDVRVIFPHTARWDGWVIPGTDIEAKMGKSPQELAKQVAFIMSHRRRVEPFDVAINGCSKPGDHDLFSEYEAAGATWWL